MLKSEDGVEIGSTVRVTSEVHLSPKMGKKRGTVVSIARKSLVAMTSDQTGFLSLVMDDLAPEPLGKFHKFLVAPQFNSVGVEVKECEAPACNTTPLLEFETVDHAEDCAPITGCTNAHLVQRYKEYGDQLLLKNDYTAAIAYYEAALSFVSSKFDDIGSTIVTRKKGHCVIAEVDCVEAEEKETKYDVTYLNNDEEEATISEKLILFSVWMKDVHNLQTRILLNLSRCLLKLSDVDITRGNASCVGEKTSIANSRQERYRLSAVLGTSIAIAISEYRALESSDEIASEIESLIEKARIVRSKAFLGLRKLPNANKDAKKVLAKNPSSRGAQSLLKELKVFEAYNKSVDKKLSREVCRWVQTATNSSKGSDAMDRVGDSVSDNESEDEGIQEGSDTSEKISRYENIPPSSSIELGRLVRGISMELVGVIAFLIAMWIVYPTTDQRVK